MDQSRTAGENFPPGVNANPLSNPGASDKMESVATTTHQIVDKVADSATVQVDRLSGAAHRPVNSTADVAASAADWASNISDQANQMNTKLTDAACASIRARPLSAVAGALVIGYLLGRPARI